MSISDRIQQSQWVPLLRSSDNIYFAPVIPNKKLQGAMSYLPHGVSPNDILMLIDDTVFGSAKVGMCLTAKGLFYKASFEDEKAYLFEHIQKVEADIGMITSSILINGQNELSFSQLDKGVIRALVAFLNECCQTKVSPSSTSVEFPPEAKTILNLYAYYLTYRLGRWDNDARETMRLRFSTDQASAEEKQYIQQLTSTPPHFNYRALLDQVWEFRDQLPYELRMQTIDELVRFMLGSKIEQEQVQYFIADLCRAFNISQQLLQDTFDLYFKRVADLAGQTDGELDMTVEEMNACKLLDIQPEGLDEQSLQQAYRQKMAEFHPDKYQTLPDSIRQLIEQQAQQLNHARAVLKAYLES
ncbi:J domain-containing protein [Acinetobacter baumannii]|uniref:J domain-containing protein n=1 Tax=Acinetobacter baumannii TaxID=470 RepID=UPI00148F2A21|nr:molecular chaperone DnaJ [Acinetobacter baumannii]MCT9253887.1 molecular chaperone DnaJ [Acinetobacter baumannii]